MLPIFELTLRALARGRRLLVVAVLLPVPALLSLAYRAGERHPDGAVFAIQLFDALLLPVLLPLMALIFATSALGNEVEDGTLPYLTLRPISRLTVVLSKLGAATLITAAIIEVSLLPMYLIAVQGAGDGRRFGAMLLAGLAGCLAYCSLFLPVGLFAPRRGFIVGLSYVLTWEGAAATFSSALATLSVRRYVQGALDTGLGAAPLRDIHTSGVDGTSSVIVLTIFVAGCIAVASWRLQHMDLP